MGAYQDFHRRSIEQRDTFWADEARMIAWHRPFERVLDYSKPPFARWFVGGLTNLCYNAVDRHLATRGDQKALIYISTEVDRQQTYTYRELHAEVTRCAAVLQALGVAKGDRVLIYMPMIPEAAFAMLACTRIGAVHSVVFGGFAAHSLASRIDDAKPKLMITSDAGMRGGRAIPYKHLVDEAIRVAQHPPQRVVIVNRGIDREMALVSGRDLDYESLRAQHMNASVPVEWLESSEPSYILYTSGTTGRPKGVQRDTGGYAVALASSMRHIYCGAPGETMFTTSDIAGSSAVPLSTPAHLRYDHRPLRGAADPPRRRHLVEDRRRQQGDGDVFLADGRTRTEEAGSGVSQKTRSLLAAPAVPRRRAAG
jgi:propionyl-CoA synthetase